MKKVFSILFSLLFVVISSGFTTYQHICQGIVQQTSMSSTYESKSECGFCKVNGKQVENPQKECCKQTVEIVKVKADFQKTSAQIVKASFFIDAILHPYFGYLFQGVVSTVSQTASFLPYVYFVREIPIYIKNCVYRI